MTSHHSPSAATTVFDIYLTKTEAGTATLLIDGDAVYLHVSQPRLRAILVGLQFSASDRSFYTQSMSAALGHGCRPKYTKDTDT